MAENLRTERSWRKDFMRHACPATWPGKTIWAEFYYGFVTDEQRNVMSVTHCKNEALYPRKPMWGQPPSAVLRAKLDRLLPLHPQTGPPPVTSLLGISPSRPYYYRMRSFFLPVLVVCALAAPFTASAQSGQAPTNSTVPAKAKKGAKAAETAPSKPEEPKRDYSQEAFVVEQYRSLYHFENDGTGRKETIARVRVQSEAGVQQWGQIQVGYNSANERVEMDYVRVIKADGSVVKAGDDAVQDLSAPLEQQAQ